MVTVVNVCVLHDNENRTKPQNIPSGGDEWRCDELCSPAPGFPLSPAPAVTGQAAPWSREPMTTALTPSASPLPGAPLHPHPLSPTPAFCQLVSTSHLGGHTSTHLPDRYAPLASQWSPTVSRVPACSGPARSSLQKYPHKSENKKRAPSYTFTKGSL